MIAGILIAVVLAFLIFRFVVGVMKFGLLALVIIVALWFVAGGTHGMSLVGGLR